MKHACANTPASRFSLLPRVSWKHQSSDKKNPHSFQISKHESQYRYFCSWYATMWPSRVRTQQMIDHSVWSKIEGQGKSDVILLVLNCRLRGRCSRHLSNNRGKTPGKGKRFAFFRRRRSVRTFEPRVYSFHLCVLLDVQPGAVKLVPWRHWMHVAQVHPVREPISLHQAIILKVICNWELCVRVLKH